MRRAVRSPNRTVREEIRLLLSLGFEYCGKNSAGHHLVEHPKHGRLRPMSNTPKNARSWKRTHRTEVARLMGLTLFQFERLVASQPLRRTSPKRKRQYRAKRQMRTPVSLRAAPDVDGVPSREPVGERMARVWLMRCEKCGHPWAIEAWRAPGECERPACRSTNVVVEIRRQAA